MDRIKETNKFVKKSPSVSGSDDSATESSGKETKFNIFRPKTFLSTRSNFHTSKESAELF